MRVAIECAGFTAGEADQLRRSHGDLQVHRRRLALPRQAGRGHGRQRLRGGLRRADVQAARGLRLLRLPREPRRLLRADRLRLLLAEVPPPGRVLRRAAQRPADGLLRPGADRPRRARARRRGPAGLRQRLALGLHAGAGRARTASPCGSACAWCAASPTPMPPGSSRPAPTSPSPASTTSGAAPAVPVASLERLAEADAFRPALGLARREALWAIKALRDAPLPLFAAASARGSRHGAGDPASRP